MSFNSMLNRTATITHDTADGSFDDLGDPTVVSTTTTAKTRLSNLSNFYVQDGKILNVKTLKAYFLPSVSIYLQDTIVIDGKTYVVTDVYDPNNSKKKHHQEVTVELMDNGSMA